MRKGPEHRELIAARVFGYVIRHGLADLSLRPLAHAVGLSPRVLLYHFGSKEQLVDGVLTTVRAHNLEQFRAARPAGKERPGAAFKRLWDQLGRPENGPYLRLFFHAYGLALQHPARYPTFLDRVVGDWLGALGQAFGDPSSVPATAALAAIRGLLLDYLTTGDLDRTTEAARVLAAMLDGIAETTNKE